MLLTFQKYISNREIPDRSSINLFQEQWNVNMIREIRPSTETEALPPMGLCKVACGKRQGC